MQVVNRRALTVPSDRLVEEIEAANAQKREVLAQRDRAYGAERPRIGSYLENIALPGLFGFDMNDYYRDPALAMEVELRHKLFWLDNSLDDGLAGLDVGAGSMYYDMTLFGLHINYQSDGVPVFERHPLADEPYLGQLEDFDFERTGEMPTVHMRYRELTRLSRERYGGAVRVHFPAFHRGPLDIAMQLRGYENFVADCAEAPGYVHRLMKRIVAQRVRYNALSAALRGAPSGEPTTFVADDWANVPFISPAMFEEFVIPAYLEIQRREGKVTGFHTCGILAPIAGTLLTAFPAIQSLDVSGWNDVAALDPLVAPDIGFAISYINTFVLCASPDEHRARLLAARRVARGRRVSIHSQAIVRLFDTLDESIVRMNRFIALARDIMAE